MRRTLSLNWANTISDILYAANSSLQVANVNKFSFIVAAILSTKQVKFYKSILWINMNFFHVLMSRINVINTLEHPIDIVEW